MNRSDKSYMQSMNCILHHCILSYLMSNFICKNNAAFFALKVHLNLYSETSCRRQFLQLLQELVVYISWTNHQKPFIFGP